jgi:hypothetical protein
VNPIQHGRHEFAGDVAVEQPVAVLAKHSGVPHRIVDAQADLPANIGRSWQCLIGSADVILPNTRSGRSAMFKVSTR